MAYDTQLAARVRQVLNREDGVTEKKMFGGISFLLRGNMSCGVLRDDLIVRVGPDHHEDAVMEPYARPMDFTGRPLKGLVYVGPDGHRSDEALAKWVKRGVEFAASLPPK